MQATPKLSRPGKMPCKTWSLPAFDTCPGAVKDTPQGYNGSLSQWDTARKDMRKDNQVPACAGCYAQGGRYVMRNVREPREHNLKDWQLSDWTDAMVKAIGQDKYFRWFDSGDVYCADLASKILEVVQRTPETKHWIPTRSYKIPGIAKVLKDIAAQPNAVVRYSSDSITGETIEGEQSSTIIPYLDSAKSRKGFAVCYSSMRGGKCGDCRACWSKDVKTVAYPAHGAKMKSNLKKMVV